MGGVLMRLKYVQPTSLTWWTGVGSVTLGILMVVDNDPWVVELASVVTLLTGGMASAPKSSAKNTGNAKVAGITGAIALAAGAVWTWGEQLWDAVWGVF